MRRRSQYHGQSGMGQWTSGIVATWSLMIVRARRLMHGKTDMVHHDGQGLFAGLENPFQATRYHSLVIEPGTLSDEFDMCAWCNAPDGSIEIMGVRHKKFPLHGVQFHPESFLTERGTDILRTFLGLTA